MFIQTLQWIWRFVRVPLAVIFVLFFGLVIYRIPVVKERTKTEEVVKKIHSQKLTMADVTGQHLPPEPNPLLKDATVEGIDANENGIRDDVELAIFKEYPNSAKTRAVLLQYALALQMEVLQPLVNTDIVVAVIQEEDRANLCIGKILSRDNIDKYIKFGDDLRSFVEKRQINTSAREEAQNNFIKKIGSYESLDRICDINYLVLPN